jgi:etoposide-induced 2.4 mRNA
MSNKRIFRRNQTKKRRRSEWLVSSTHFLSCSFSLYFREKSKVALRVFQCCALNGGLFLLSILFFYYLLLPFLEVLITHFTDSGIWSYINVTLSWIFSCIWVMPLFLLSKIFNFFWFQDIADATYEFRRGKRTLLPSISLLLADVVFSIIVQTLFLLQVS